jgi:hypothetical protein
MDGASLTATISTNRQTYAAINLPAVSILQTYHDQARKSSLTSRALQRIALVATGAL